MLFLVPDKNDPKIQNEFETIKSDKSISSEEQRNIKMISWDDIIKIIDDVLSDEMKFKIAPMSDYLKQTLKAFCFYIKKNRNNIIIQNKIYVEYKKYNNKSYELLQLSDGKMRIRCENDSKDLIVKNMIYDILYKLKSESCDKKKTTQELGKEVFKKINEIKVKKIIIDSEKPYFNPQQYRTGSNE